MLDRFLREAPPRFDEQFLDWVYQVEEVLQIRFSYWHPADAEEVRQHARAIGQQIPSDLGLYYRYADPVGRLRDGWRRWREREEEYRAVWARMLTARVGLACSEARRQVEDSPPLWPILCFESSTFDDVAFVWREGEIVVIRLDLRAGGRAKPDTIGLRNYFLHGIVLETLAEQEIEPVDWDRLYRDPRVIDASGWPKESPFPEHVALAIGRLSE